MTEPRHTRLSVDRRTRGQVMILLAIVISAVLVPIGLAVLAIDAQRADHAAVAALVSRAALDGTGALNDTSLTAGTPDLAGSSASCIGATDEATAAGRVCRSLRQGLWSFSRGPYPRIDVPNALAHTAVMVLDGSPDAPVIDPATRLPYHYPTVCVAATIRIGVLEADGLGVSYRFHACAQAAYR